MFSSSLAMFVLTTACAASPGEPVVGEEEVRAAVQRSLPYIEERGAWWIENKDCVSCHRVGTMLWSLSAARQRGFAVSDRLEEWYDWALDQSLSKNDKDKIVGAGNKEGVAQLLLGRHGLPDTPRRAESYIQLASILQGDQQPDGSWKPGGQLPFQKRPKPETTAVSTMWLALALADAKAAGESSEVIEKAWKHTDSSEPGSSTEWFSTRLLGAARRDDADRTEQLIGELKKQQNADGGWGWLVGEPSDALGTGLALYALLRAGARNEPAVQRGLAFLVKTQQDDGSWAVNGTKTKGRDRVVETARYWGTTWAVIALVESLPERK